MPLWRELYPQAVSLHNKLLSIHLSFWMLFVQPSHTIKGRGPSFIYRMKRKSSEHKNIRNKLCVCVCVCVCLCVCLCMLVTQLCPTLCNPVDCSFPGFSVHEKSTGRNTGVDCCALLQGIFPTQRSNPCLLHSRQILYCLSNQGNP